MADPKPKKLKPPPTKREFINPFLLLGIVGGAMFAIMLVLGTIQFFLSQAGAVVEETLAYVPADCNVIRGCNIKQMKLFPGYQSEADKLYTKELSDAFDVLAKATGKEPATLLTYLIIGREVTKQGSRSIYFFALKSSVDREFAKSIDKARERQIDGNNCYQLPSHSNPALNSALVYCPNSKLIVMAPASPNQEKLMKGVMATRNLSSSERIPAEVGTAGKLATRGHIWTIIRPVGDMKDYVSKTTATVKEGLAGLATAGGQAKCLSFWVSIGGGGVRLATAMELGDSASAESLVKAMKDGPMGKGDESVPPNDFKQAVPVSGQKPFMEFMQYIDFQSSGPCAYIKSKVNAGENSKQMLVLFNYEPTVASGTPTN